MTLMRMKDESPKTPQKLLRQHVSGNPKQVARNPPRNKFRGTFGPTPFDFLAESQPYVPKHIVFLFGQTRLGVSSVPAVPVPMSVLGKQFRRSGFQF